MRVVTTFISSSSILCSIKCKLDDSDTEYLVLAKPNKIEVFALQPEGAKFQCGLEIWGMISSLNAIPQTNSTLSTLLVTTESPDPLAIVFEYVQGETEHPFLREVYHISLLLPFSRTMEDFEGAVVHPSGRIAVVATYVGKLRVLVFNKNPRKIAKEFDCILTQLNVLSICFLPASDPNVYVLGILYRDHTDTIRLIAREVNLDVQDLVDGSSFFSETTISEEHAVALLPVPASSDGPGGVLVLGGRKIFFFELVGSKRRDKGKGKEKTSRRKSTSRISIETGETESIPEPKASVDWLMSELTAYEPIDDGRSRVLLSDKYGRLCLLSLLRSSGDISMRVDHLGETSSAMTLTYLNAGVIFVGSHFGDSQIIRITTSTDGYEGPQLQVLDVFTNIAPIMDAILVNQGPGQSQIITCSGAHNSGSIRVIHSGIDLQESAIIDHVSYVKSIWALKPNYDSQHDSILAISSLQSTRFFSLVPSHTEKLEEVSQDYAGFSNEYTLAMCNMATIVPDGNGQFLYQDSHYVVQVTRKAVLLINMLTGLRDAIWDGGSEIISASVNAAQIAVALQGNKLVVLMIKDGDLVQLRFHEFQQRQICSLTIRPYDSSLPFSNYIAVGFYDSNTITIVQTADLTSAVLPPFSVPHLPVSVLLCQFGQDASGKRRTTGYSRNHPSELLVACGDGNVYAYSLTFAGGRASIIDQKVIHLGSTRPAFLSSIQTHLRNIPGQECVLASGTVPMVIYYSDGRLRYSPLVRKGITTACSINAPDFPSSVIFAVSSDLDGRVVNTSLLIGQVKELRKLHIRKITFGLDNPLRITHHHELQLLCVGCQRSQPHSVGQYPLESSSFKFLDDTTFEQLYHFPCDNDEEATASRTLSLKLGQGADAERKLYVVVGTQYYRSGETEAREGRIILFESRSFTNYSQMGSRQEASGEGKIGLACSTKVKGCVFAVAEVAGRLFAAINESIYVFQVSPLEQQGTISTGVIGVQLVEVAKWTHNYIVGNMVARGDRIYIGDTVNSLSVVQWDETNQRLSNVARDYAPLWPVAIETTENDAILGCDNDCNLFLYRINATERRLEQAGNYHLGETVNKFVSGTLTTQNETTVRSEQMFVTSTGRIGVISEFDEKLSLQMSALQRNLGHFIIGPGSMKHSRWRSPKNSKGGSDLTGESTGFLDGDFLEKFLEFENNSPEVAKAISGSTEAEKLDMTFPEIVHTLERLQSVH